MSAKKIVKSRLSILALTVLVALALTACVSAKNGSEASTPTPSTPPTPSTLTVEEYTAELDNLNTAAGDFVSVTSTAMTTVDTASASGDLESMRGAVEEIRATIVPFQEFAAIDNPPAEYAEAHAKIVEGCSLFASSIDSYCTDLIAVIDGKEVDIDASTQTYSENTTTAATLMSEGISMAQEIANG